MLYSTKKIAITGTAQSGKTTFLVSLLNHLRVHDPYLFRMARDKDDPKKIEKRRFIKFRELPNKRFTGWDTFLYEVYRDNLSSGRWPKKTVAHALFTAQVTMPCWYGSANLHLFDVPGERFVDAKLVTSEYDTWSDVLAAKICGGDFQAKIYYTTPINWHLHKVKNVV